MLLYDAPGAPSPRRVRLFLAEKRIEVPRVEVSLRDNAQLSADFRARVPRGMVPALVLDDGTVIDESVAICRYFEMLHPEPPLMGADAREAALIEAWGRRIEAELYGAVVAMLRNAAERFDGRALPGFWPERIEQIPALVARGRRMWDLALDRLDAHLAGRAWIATDRYSFADLSAQVAVDFGVRACKLTLGARPELSRWHQAVSARPGAEA